MRSLVLTVLLAAFALSAGCGGSGGDGEAGRFEAVFDEVEGLAGPARIERLRELTREEGNELVLYASLTDESAKAVARAFERRHGVDVSLFRAGGEDVARRVSEETKAGRRGADVVDTGGGEMVGLNAAGALVPYEPAALPGLDPAARHDGWTGSRFQTYVVSWNTERVRDDEVPRAIEELAHPRWRGRIALEAGDADWYKTLREHWIGTGKSEDETDRLFEALVRNSRVTSSHSLQSELLGAGDFDLAVSSYLYLVRSSIEKGAPVKYEPLVTPVISRPNGVGLVKGAEHPAAAVLFVEWFLGEGQEVLVENDVEPTRRGLLRLDSPIVHIDVEEFGAELQEWNDRYDELLRGAERVGE